MEIKNSFHCSQPKQNKLGEVWRNKIISGYSRILFNSWFKVIFKNYFECSICLNMLRIAKLKRMALESGPVKIYVCCLL